MDFNPPAVPQGYWAQNAPPASFPQDYSQPVAQSYNVPPQNSYVAPYNPTAAPPMIYPENQPYHGYNYEANSHTVAHQGYSTQFPQAHHLKTEPPPNFCTPTPPPHEIITCFTPPPSVHESIPPYEPLRAQEVINLPPPSFNTLPPPLLPQKTPQAPISHLPPPYQQPTTSSYPPPVRFPPQSVSVPPPAIDIIPPPINVPPPIIDVIPPSLNVPPPSVTLTEQHINQSFTVECYSKPSQSTSIASYYDVGIIKGKSSSTDSNPTQVTSVTSYYDEGIINGKSSSFESLETVSTLSTEECKRKQQDFILKCMYPKRVKSPLRVRKSRSPSISRKPDSLRSSRSSSSSSRRRERSPSPGPVRLSRTRPSERKELDRRHWRDTEGSKVKEVTSRQRIVAKWRMNNCSSANEMTHQMEEICQMKPEDLMEREKIYWTRTAPADLYYERESTNSLVLKATPKLTALCDRFQAELLERGSRVRALKKPYNCPGRKTRLKRNKCCQIHDDSESESGLEEEEEEEEDSESDDGLLEELERKKSHPDRLHPELWYNDPGEMNDGPVCRCSAKAKRSGIRHNIYAGELNLKKCDVACNNSDKLFHYRITISPPTNFLIKTPTIIEHDHHEFIFEGFSMLSHKPLDNLPVCKVIRFNIEYTILYIEEKMPDHFTIRELDLFYEYLFKEILELADLDLRAAGDSEGCAQFHFMPRFVRELPEHGKEILSMNVVLAHLLNSSKPLIAKEDLKEIINLPLYKWQNLVDEVKGMVVTYPGKKPCSIRIDQLDKDQSDAKKGEIKFPEIVHFGIRPPQLSYAGNPEYQKAWREYVKFRHLLANMPKASFEDKRRLEAKEARLQEMRTQSKMKRDVTIAISSRGFYRTGIMCDVVQHAMLIPVLASHLRFHRALDVLENDTGYKFKNRSLLQLALTHPSYRENFGTNPDHARNSLTNCGIRQPEYGDRRIHYMNTRKRGINTLINIMSRFGKKRETESNITHNERLEFLGDAVVEFVTSIHLFHLFPRLEEGGLATYRAAIVQNQHLAVLAKTLRLDSYMLYAHGSDLCHDLELRHAMANCFEALMGALFLDGGIEIADKVFGETLFKESCELLEVWINYPPHPLQEQEPTGDRQWIKSFKILQDLTDFEESIGVQFTHIRLLARAFTDRSIGYTNLTLGSNQRLEFLGDTVLQLIASDYLYKHFPEHHEGHLSLLRSSLVNNRTQSVVCDDLGMSKHAIYANPKAELKTKDRADLLEAFLGALYVDKGIEYCETFCNVCFFPRLHDFIMHQDWNDPKSKLQQCCLTLRTMEGGEPEIPIYKVIECMGPTNTRLYTVAVYFKGKRLAQASGHSIQQAEMNAAKQALDASQRLFPQLDHQRRVIAKSMKRQQPGPSNGYESGSSSSSSSSSERESEDGRERRRRAKCSPKQPPKEKSPRGKRKRPSPVPDGNWVKVESVEDMDSDDDDYSCVYESGASSGGGTLMNGLRSPLKKRVKLEEGELRDEDRPEGNNSDMSEDDEDFSVLPSSLDQLKSYLDTDEKEELLKLTAENGYLGGGNMLPLKVVNNYKESSSDGSEDDELEEGEIIEDSS